MQAPIQGRRIPVVPGLDPYIALEKPGDYYGPVMGFTGDRPAVFYLLPIMCDVVLPKWERVLAHVQSPPHVFTEELDGSLTIRESILTENHRVKWHGYLTKGVWQEC